ncbi:MAG: hypothetical protein AMXMBFR48_20850 [Ignavibacteriales bacterium]
MLKNTADEFLEAGDGEEAVELYLRHRPDYILMDIEMPKLDGLSATRNILLHDPAAQVIIVTSHDNESYRRAATEAGAVDFVRKDDIIRLKKLLLSKKKHN